MTYKEFGDWCNQRAADGCWGFQIAIICSEMYTNVLKAPFWKRKKIWEQEYKATAEEIVAVVNDYYSIGGSNGE